MDPNSILLTDWRRIFIGPVPTGFLLEVIPRTIIIYVFLLVAMKFLGKRMSGQISITEVAVMLTLGAIVSVPMVVIEKGILPAVVILACVVFLQRGLNRLAFYFPRFDVAIHGRETMVVKDGRLELEALREAALPADQVLALLRNQNVTHLGEVKRAYLEADGGFGIFMDPHPKPGLPVLPLEDTKLISAHTEHMRGYACVNCGEVRESEPHGRPCPRCSRRQYVPAILAHSDPKPKGLTDG